MSHTCVKDVRMEERELQFWRCEYPAHTKEMPYRNVEKVKNQTLLSILTPNLLNVSLPPYTLDSSASKHFQRTET